MPNLMCTIFVYTATSIVVLVITISLHCQPYNIHSLYNDNFIVDYKILIYGKYNMNGNEIATKITPFYVKQVERLLALGLSLNSQHPIVETFFENTELSYKSINLIYGIFLGKTSLKL